VIVFLLNTQGRIRQWLAKLSVDRPHNTLSTTLSYEIETNKDERMKFEYPLIADLEVKEGSVVYELSS
jgi:hypothetical protein